MDNKYIGIIGIVALLGGLFGGSIYLSPNELANAFICNTTSEVGIFYGGISSTGLTAYPFAENRSSYKRCTNGAWINLETYAKSRGIDPVTLMIPPKQTNIVSGHVFDCGQYECRSR